LRHYEGMTGGLALEMEKLGFPASEVAGFRKGRARTQREREMIEFVREAYRKDNKTQVILQWLDD
ncbi:MAG: hypothetical protein OXC81_06600, partial [Betaproteobacteria bacterium]|nr:hypothetical protein [Betaproteobacteria bacterium]